MKKNRKVFIGVAWPYVNGELHVGHVAGYLLPSDIFARFNRLVGNEVLMVSGSDCFGTPITVEAEKRNLTPEDIVNEYHAKNILLFEKLGMTYDLYTKTDSQIHRETVQDFLRIFWKKKLLKVETQLQYFDTKLEIFLPDRYVEGICPYCNFEGARSDQCDNCGRLLEQNLVNPQSKRSGTKVELKETDHLVVEWGRLEDDIKTYFNDHKDCWKPWVANETKGWLDRGLQSRAITRDILWGVEIPEEIGKHLKDYKNKRIYVWFDAVIGYLSASIEWAKINNKEWKDFWYGDVDHYYFMGKDNLVFHTIFWPGQLMTYDQEIKCPDFPEINQFLNFSGQKFSKSRGLFVGTEKFINILGVDALRFYLTYIMPESADTDFSWGDFLAKNNDVLVGQIGNYINRVLSIYKDQKIFKARISERVLDECKTALIQSKKHINNAQFKLYLEDVMKLAQFANKYFNDYSPWKLKKDDPDKFEEIASDLLGLAMFVAILMQPITPKTIDEFMVDNGNLQITYWPEAEKLEKYLENLLATTLIGDVKPLFRKYNDEDLKEFIVIDS